jgi:tetratricopeptide (TPR) repeat protein
MGDEAWAARLLSEIGYVRLEEGDWAAAEALFQQARAYYDASSDALGRARLRRYLAQAALGMGQSDRALALLADAERLLDGAAGAESETLARMLLHSARMTAHHRRGELTAAEAAGRETERFHSQLNLTRAYGEFRVELGDVLFRLGRGAEAARQWETFVSSCEGMPHLPEHAEAQARLAWLAAGRGERAEAARLAREARQTLERHGQLARGEQVGRLLGAIEAGAERPGFDVLFGL